MKDSFIKIFMVGVVLTASIKNVSAQSAATDSLSMLAFQKTAADFHTSIGQQSRLYNGPEYQFHRTTIKGNAYFNDVNTWQPATITYDGIYYENAKILYDVYLDLVPVLWYDNYSMFSLLPERLESFTLNGQYFINIKTATTQSGIKPGIYNVLYNGKLNVLSKQSKSLQTIANTTGPPEQFFRSTITFFIKKNNTYYSVADEGDALTVLKDRKKELKQYIRDNQIKFRKNPGMAMMMIATEYDRLTN